MFRAANDCLDCQDWEPRSGWPGEETQIVLESNELYSMAGLADMNENLATAYSYDAYGKVNMFWVAPVTGDSDSDGDMHL